MVQYSLGYKLTDKEHALMRRHGYDPNTCVGMDLVQAMVIDLCLLREMYAELQCDRVARVLGLPPVPLVARELPPPDQL